MKVSIITLPFRKMHLISPVYDAIFGQTHKDLEVIAVINADDGAKEILQREYRSEKILDPGKNLGFACGNNLGIKNSTGEFIQLVNPDLIMEPDYIEKLLKAFNDSKVAAATGKLLRYDFEKNQKTNVIDSTGVVMSSSGRGRDRGQNEEDKGQYDNQREVFGVSGAAAMYRRSALEKIAYNGEYFDEDFVAYWEDVDLSWRLNNARLKNVYVPGAVAFHGRTAGSSKGGYLHIFNFIKHHRTTISPEVRKFNYKNHILMFIKNAPLRWLPLFIVREIAMLGYIILFETSTLKVVPELLRQIPGALKKRASRL